MVHLHEIPEDANWSIEIEGGSGVTGGRERGGGRKEGLLRGVRQLWG